MGATLRPVILGANMPELLPGAVFTGILTALAVIVLRARAAKPSLRAWKLGLVGVFGAYAVTPALAFLADAWLHTPWLPHVTSGQVFLGLWTGFAVLLISQPAGQPPRVPLWAGVLAGVAVAALLPPVLDRMTGSYQPASLHGDLNHCMVGAAGRVQPHQVTNTCTTPITVGLCLPGEINPTPCVQRQTLQPGETAQFDPGDARQSSLPSNPNGLTIVACRPPARPSRGLSNIGRGHEGVCLPPA